MGRISYVFPDEIHFEAKALAARQGIKFRVWLERAIAAEVERQKAEEERRRRSR